MQQANYVDLSSDEQHGSLPDIADFFTLLKPRVMALVIFTAICGLLLAPGTIHPVIGLAAILFIAIGAGASGALNMWYDRDIDSVMTRTKQRPLPSGAIAADAALAYGIILSVASVALLGLTVNLHSAFWLAFTIFFYVVIYTVLLKRSTSQNIVIGGAAGALPPVIGWTAVTGDAFAIEPWILFTIIFMWTPSHFWALALYKSADYAAAKVPMLPITHGSRSTKIHILIYSSLLVLSSIVPYIIGMSSSIYLYSSILLGIAYLWLAFQVLISDDHKPAVQLFLYSIFYLFCLFLCITLDKLFVMS